jgi:NAD(P)-dependent dehydrogenase (short-subunit alcohol dehydrogenase family)
LVAAIDLDGQVVIVTGGARGIGRAYCLDFGARGARVVVADTSADEANAVVASIKQAGGSSVAACYDVATKVGGEQIVQETLHEFGRVDAIVNNAGILRPGYFEDLTEDQIDSVLAVHLKGAFFVTQPAWGLMKQQGYGRVVITSSSSGMFSHQAISNYAAAKAGLYGLTKALAYEGRPYGIAVNCILPSATTTISEGNPIPGFDLDWGSPEGTVPDSGRSWSQTFETINARRPPSAVAALVTLLVSRSCPVNGGAFIAASGWYGRVAVAKARGWLAPDASSVRAEDVQAHWEEIQDQSSLIVPEDMLADMSAIAKAIEELDAGVA